MVSESYVTEGNILIAKFIGTTEVFQGEVYYKIPEFFCGRKVENLKFHSDWNWLMLAVDKIEEFRFEDSSLDDPGNNAYLRTFSNTGTRINRFQLFQMDNKKLSTWYAVVDFIKWYNEKGYDKKGDN